MPPGRSSWLLAVSRRPWGVAQRAVVVVVVRLCNLGAMVELLLVAVPHPLRCPKKAVVP